MRLFAKTTCFFDIDEFAPHGRPCQAALTAALQQAEAQRITKGRLLGCKR